MSFASYPSLRGRVVFITGGGSGIGAVTGKLLAQRGWRVALLDRDGALAEKTAADEMARKWGMRSEARFAGIQDATPGIIVIITKDFKAA